MTLPLVANVYNRTKKKKLFTTLKYMNACTYFKHVACSQSKVRVERVYNAQYS